jgi:hypothetical protein
MSKLKVLFILCMVVMLAVVAVIPNLGQARSFQDSQMNGASSSVTAVEILTADGTDPQPPPMPLPWLGVAS